MVSRWQRKSQEEKNALALKDFERRKVQQARTGFNQGEAAKILEASEIPIACPHCLKWTACDRYELGLFKTLLTSDKEFEAIRGLCKTCGMRVQRVRPDNEEMMLWPIILNQLRAEGRLTGTWNQ